MNRIHVFADEAGNFDFSRKPGATRHFILATVTMTDCSVGEDLLTLRRQLAWDGVDLRLDGFHATEDRQAVRDAVFDVLTGHEFTVDATILDKTKAHPRIQADETYFYQLAWYLHFKHLAKSFDPDNELLVIAAALKTNKKRQAAHQAVHNVVSQVSSCASFRVAFWPASIDPCLQVADYCSWAIQRKWERDDGRSYVLIENKIRSEFDAFALGTKVYY